MPNEYDDDLPDYDCYCAACDCGLFSGDVEEIDDETFCDECYRERTGADGLIKSWSYKPTPSFLNDDGSATSYYQRIGKEIVKDRYGNESPRSKLYMGFEQEVECLNRSLKEGAERVLLKANEEQQIVYLKEDGSIDYGFEIVSHPGTLEFFMNHFNWEAISTLSQMKYKSWERKSCGLHIHMSRLAFANEKHLFKFLVFIYKNPNQLIQFAGRQTHYAKFDIDAFLNGYDGWGHRKTVRGSSFMKMAKDGHENDDRYCAVNLKNVQTIELRFFRPSLLPTTVQAALQFCDAAFNYTEMISTQEIMSKNALGFSEFSKWVKTQQDKYKILNERITTRVSV